MSRLRPAILLAMAPALFFAAAQDRSQSARPETSLAVRHDVSAPLRDIQVQPLRGQPDRQMDVPRSPDMALRQRPFTKGLDPLLQSQPGVSVTPSLSFSFEGGSDDDNAALAGGRVVPPDTNGDVGPNHYVQIINLLISVYDKTPSHNLLMRKPNNALWAGFGGDCETHNDGDPVVLYDHLAARWVVSQFAVGTNGHQCVAVSTSNDPTLSYYRYDFVVSPNGAFNDYPKLGVWPDGYYMSANQFTSRFEGAIAVVFERSKMLTGETAQMVKFGPLPCGTECFFSLQPSDLDGPAPPAGTPNSFVMSFDDQAWGTGTKPDGYRLWNFSVNWTIPSASSFTALPQVDSPSFDANLCNYSACVTQPKGERLDTLSQFTMYPAQFRHFSDHDSIVISHSVDATGRNRAAPRWAELRNVAGAWLLQQSGTYAPDADHRWMSSAALDKQGNMALGYSVSSRSQFPSIRYTTRLASDALGMMGSEVSLQEGTGSQKSSYNRWGDYSAMRVDPVDGCTFWYTNEYYQNTGSFDFKTRIGSFRIPSCL